MEPYSFFPAHPGLAVSLLAQACGASLAAMKDGDRIIRSIAPLRRAEIDDITFISSSKSLADLVKCKAGAVLCTPGLAGHVPDGVVVLVVSQPQAAFAVAAALLYPSALKPLRIAGGGGISDRAIVDASARLEAGVIVEAGAVVAADVQIGSGTVIAANAVIGPGTRIGRHSHIGPGATVQHALIGNEVIVHTGARIGQDGFGFAAGSRGLIKIVQLGRVIVQDHVEIGANTCIDRGALDDTVIGEGTKIDNLVQIGHNVRIGRHCVIVSQVGIAGSTTLGDGVMIGGASGVNGHISIGDGAQIAAMSGVLNDVPPGVKWGGVPARPMRAVLRDAAEANARAFGKSGAEGGRGAAIGDDKGGDSQ